ncbi:MAG: hypothetical protein PHY47_01000 [Lachnospiraceae bacterium]|nr:hypothetical protein [Lachnospiraceae bacterium]
MEILSQETIRLANTPKIKFPEPYSLQLFFKENKTFFIHQTNGEDGNPVIDLSESPMDGIEPEVKVMINASIAEGVRFIDSSNIQLRCIPHADKKKAILLLDAFLGC